jgi:N-acetylglutamate synthase-like GNAT family acetyltransferase
MIRPAKLNDADQISQLIKENYLDKKKDKKDGFLRYKRSPKTVKKIIKKSLVSLVYIKNKKIVGFMNAYPQRIPKKKKINWQNKKAKKIYFDKTKSATAFLGVVHPDYLHQGIGKKLFKKLISNLKRKEYQYLFASITLQPITNKASLSFIKSFGFNKAATAKVKSNTGTETGIFWKEL